MTSSFFHLTRLHPLLLKTLRLMSILAALLLACVLYVALIGVSIDASGLRGKVVALLTESLGREVRFDGPLQLVVSAHPKLVVGGLHIANAAGFGEDEFASLGEARLALDLWPLLLMRLQIDELSGSDVHIRLQLDKQGRSNWTFKSSAHKPEQTPAKDQAASKELGNLLARLDIERVSLDNLNVEFIGANAKSHYFELQSLDAQFPAGQPLMLTLQGTVEKKYPYKLDLAGGTIAELAHFDKPWPFDLTLEFMSSRLSLNGNVSGSTGEINFGLGTENLAEFERLLQTELPAVGIAGISGTVKYAPGNITLNNLNGIMGKTTLSGALNFNYSGERPGVRGELDLPVLDLRPFMTGQPTAQEAPSQSLADMYREIALATFNLKDLKSADADLTLRVGQWLHLPGAVHDAMLQVRLKQGRLTVPMQATMADVKLSGSASADASLTPARFKLALGTHDSSLGNLAGVLLGMQDVKGQLGRFDLRVAARGDRGSELMQSLDVRLNVERGKLAYGNEARAVRFTLDNLTVALPAGKALQGETHGELLDNKFSAKLSGGSLTDIMSEANAPVDFELRAGSARASIHAVLQPPTENSGSVATFELTAPHSGEIAGWLGLKPGADAPISLHGKFTTDNDSWNLSDFVLQLGHSNLSAEVSRDFDQGKSLLKLLLTGELIDVDELQSLLPEKDKKAQEAAPAAAPKNVSMIDIPILPHGINLADADIVVRIGRIASASPFAVRDVRFDGHIRDGMMSASPFSVNVAENNFSGAILLDLRTGQPHSVLWLSVDALDIGRILGKMGIAGNIDAGIDRVSLQLDLHSSHLGQLLEQSELVLDFEGGHLTLTDANTGGKMRIALERGELKSEAGAPVYLDLTGSLDNIPVSIGIQTAKAADLINPDLAIPFKFIASASGAAVQLSGNIDRPFTKKDIELALDMSGIRMDDLNTLAHTSLPPWGPWQASGKFHMSQSGYEVSTLQLQVGSSQLNGQGKMDTQTVPPRIDVALSAPTIQLDDFRFGDWSPEKAKPAATAKQESKSESGRQAQDGKPHAQNILSREVLLRQNAYLSVRVDQVVSGEDLLGSGKLDAKLENGRAYIGPVVVNTPGGSASLQLGYEPGEKDVAVNLRAEAKHFDYGILARRIDTKSEMRGVFSLDVDVSARAQYLSELLRYGKGHIDFAVWPENLKSGLLDIWAVNVLMALLPAVDSSDASRVNCAIGRFVLGEGKLSDKTFLIDTSRMRVTGKGGVDFATDDIQLYVQPHAKTPQFLSFAIPIELSGKLNDFHVGVRPEDVLETAGQLASSIVVVPMRMLFGKKIPADGHDVCAADEFK